MAHLVDERLTETSFVDALHHADSELALQYLAQQETNEIMSNAVPKPKKDQTKKNKQAAPALPCQINGTRDLCDDKVCGFDSECRSGCCTQVLTKGYSRCTAMLVGDYCPRALDPVNEFIQAEKAAEEKK